MVSKEQFPLRRYVLLPKPSDIGFHDTLDASPTVFTPILPAKISISDSPGSCFRTDLYGTVGNFSVFLCLSLSILTWDVFTFSLLCKNVVKLSTGRIRMSRDTEATVGPTEYLRRA